MHRFLGLTGLVFGVALLVGAWGQEPAKDKKDPPEILLKKKDKPVPAQEGAKEADKKDKKKEEKKDPKKREKLPDPDPEGGDNPAQLIERIKKNLAASEERLEKKDPGTETRKVQEQIVKDLDELIKQEQDQQNSRSQTGSKGSSGGSSSAQKNSARPKSAGNRKDPKSSAGQKPGKPGSQQKDPTQGPQPLTGAKKPAATFPRGGNKGAAQGKNTIADLFKDIWGHLPQTRRLEMDAYSRERFMPRYEDLLRQYYRTIAEQGRRKEGE